MYCCLMMSRFKSLSQIINNSWNKKEITVKAVWEIITNVGKRSLWISLRITSINGLRSYVKHSKDFHPFSTHLEVGLKKLGFASFFQATSRVWKSDETLPLFDVHVWFQKIDLQ